MWRNGWLCVVASLFIAGPLLAVPERADVLRVYDLESIHEQQSAILEDASGLKQYAANLIVGVEDIEEREKFIRQYVEARRIFFNFVTSDAALKDSDIAILKSVLQDSRADDSDRHECGLVLYCVTGEVAYMAEALICAPNRWWFFTKVKDSQFEMILRTLLGRIANERITQTVGVPYRSDRAILAHDGLPYLIEAIGFQRCGERDRLAVWEAVVRGWSTFHPLEERVNATEVARKLQEAGSAMLPEFCDAAIVWRDARWLYLVASMNEGAHRTVKGRVDALRDSLQQLWERVVENHR